MNAAPRHVAFVVPFRFETSLRFLRRALDLDGAAISLISQDPLDRFADVRGRLAGHRAVDDAMQADQLVDAVRGLSRTHGPVDRLIGVLEQVQVPLAEARAALGLPGLSVDAAHNFRDKARMKDVLRKAGLPCARHRLARSTADVRAFLDEVGFPVILKPPAGAGAVNTFRVDRADQLGEALAAFAPDPRDPMLLEEFILGEEHSFDCVSVAGRPVWHSISRYAPGPLEVLRNDWIQWTVLLPRDVGGPEYDAIRRAGPAALAALGMQTGLTHMEWFRRAKDGSVALSEVGARPPGAQFTTLMSYAHDCDMYRAWARLAVFDAFEPPPRKYAVGAAYLRGQGGRVVKHVHGLGRAQQEMGSLVVEAKLPHAGQQKATSYEGEGFVILRHEDTGVVERALKRVVEVVQVEMA